MTPLMYLFLWRQLEWTRRTCHFDVASSPFKYRFGVWCGRVLLWRNPLGLKKRKEFV